MGVIRPLPGRESDLSFPRLNRNTRDGVTSVTPSLVYPFSTFGEL